MLLTHAMVRSRLSAYWLLKVQVLPALQVAQRGLLSSGVRAVCLETMAGVDKCVDHTPCTPGIRFAETCVNVLLHRWGCVDACTSGYMYSQMCKEQGCL